jgi:hypothetical protein
MSVAGVGLLIIRTWPEPGSDRPLRADVRLTADTTRGFELELTLSDFEEVQSVVRAWLAEILAAGMSGTSPQAAPELAPSRAGNAGVTARSE